MKIKKFNSEGHNKWIEFYNELFIEIKKVSKGSVISPEDIKKGYNENFKEKYELIKNSEDLSEELSQSKNFEIKAFKNSYELAKSVNLALSDYNFYEVDKADVWDWIAMILFDQIFVPGKIRGASPYRYAVNINDFFTSFRHLIRGPCWAENQFKENSKIFTHTKAYQQNDWLEQFIKVSFLREMKVMGKVCSELYFDFEKNEAIPGTSKTTVSNPDKPGIFPRLRNKLSQFNKVKYLWGMEADEIIKMLPKEFNNYKKNITK
jgi:hypothetical protein